MRAVIARAYKNGLEEIIQNYKIVDEVPFDFVRRRLSVVVDDGKEKLIITKGAVEEILIFLQLLTIKEKYQTLQEK